MRCIGSGRCRLRLCLFSWAIVVALRIGALGKRGSLATHDDGAVMNGAPGSVAGWGLWFVLGVLWGLIALTNASLMLCLPAMLVWIVWPQVGAWKLGRGNCGGVVLTCVAFGAVLAPWVVRNVRVMGAPVLTRDQFWGGAV